MFSSCLAETIAVAFTTAERETTSNPIMKRAIDQVSADESLHARFGWAFAEEVSPHLGDAELQQTNNWLRVAFAYLEREEMLEIPDIRPPSIEVIEQNLALGVCENDQTRDLFYETVRDVIIPALNALGFDASAAWSRRHEAIH